MAKLLLMRGAPMPIKAALQVLLARLQPRVEEQRSAASDEGGQDKQEEVRAAHAAALKKSPRTAFGDEKRSGVARPWEDLRAIGAREAPGNVLTAEGLPFIPLTIRDCSRPTAGRFTVSPSELVGVGGVTREHIDGKPLRSPTPVRYAEFALASALPRMGQLTKGGIR